MAGRSFTSPFTRISTGDVMELVQDNIENSFRALESCPLLDGHLLEGVELVQGDNEIDHKLGRVLRGWILTRQDFDTIILDKQASNDSTDRILILNSSASGTATVDLWVF